MAYLAVDKTGDEYIFQNKPVRLSTGWCSFELSAIKLPKRSIIRLTGSMLTWMDEPVELVTSSHDEFYLQVCSISGCDIDSLYTKTRKRETVYARQIIMAHRKIYLGLSFSQAGAEFNKDHCTVIHAIKKIKELSLDKAYMEQYGSILDEYPELLKYDIRRYEKVND